MKSEEFKELRVKAGLSQQKMAEILGKSITSVRDWERGRTPIDGLVADGIIRRMRGLVKEAA